MWATPVKLALFYSFGLILSLSLFRVIYTRAIKKDGGYTYAAKNFVNTYVSCTKLFFTQMPFWMDGKVTELLDGV
jgi:hypothetical protein